MENGIPFVRAIASRRATSVATLASSDRLELTVALWALQMSIHHVVAADGVCTSRPGKSLDLGGGNVSKLKNKTTTSIALAPIAAALAKSSTLSEAASPGAGHGRDLLDGVALDQLVTFSGLTLPGGGAFLHYNWVSLGKGEQFPKLDALFHSIEDALDLFPIHRHLALELIVWVCVFPGFLHHILVEEAMRSVCSVDEEVPIRSK